MPPRSALRSAVRSLVTHAAHHARLDVVHLRVAAASRRPAPGGEPGLEDATVIGRWARRPNEARSSSARSTSFIDCGDTRARRASWALDSPLRRSSTLSVVYWLTESPWALTTVVDAHGGRPDPCARRGTATSARCRRRRAPRRRRSLGRQRAGRLQRRRLPLARISRSSTMSNVAASSPAASGRSAARGWAAPRTPRPRGGSRSLRRRRG